MANRENSICSLGSGYVNDFFQGALLLDKKNSRVLRVFGGDTQQLLCVTLGMDQNLLEARWSSPGRGISVTFDELGTNTFSAFSWPKMGYRNVPCQRLGNTVWFLQTNRGTGRGLRDESIIRDMMSIFNISSGTNQHSWNPSGFASNAAARALVVFNPKWYSFKEGMAKLREGEWLGFALNEDIAITVAHQSPTASGFDVYFRGTLAGSISEEGHLLMRNKVLSRTSLQKFLNEEMYV